MWGNTPLYGGILITTQIIGWIFNKWLDDVFAN